MTNLDCAEFGLCRIWITQNLYDAEFVGLRRICWIVQNLLDWIENLDFEEFGSHRIWMAQNLDHAEFGSRRVWITQNLAWLTYTNLKSQHGPWIKLAEPKSDDKGRLSNMYDVWVRSIWIRRQRIPLLALLRLGSSGWNSFFCFFTVDLKIKVMRVRSNIFCNSLTQKIYKISHLPWF